MRAPGRRFAFVAALALTVCGCGDSLAPRAMPTGTYQLIGCRVLETNVIATPCSYAGVPIGDSVRVAGILWLSADSVWSAIHNYAQRKSGTWTEENLLMSGRLHPIDSSPDSFVVTVLSDGRPQGFLVVRSDTVDLISMWRYLRVGEVPQ